MNYIYSENKATVRISQFAELREQDVSLLLSLRISTSKHYRNLSLNRGAIGLYNGVLSPMSTRIRRSRRTRSFAGADPGILERRGIPLPHVNAEAAGNDN